MKKYLFMCLMAAVCFTFTSCGDKEEPETNGNENTENTSGGNANFYELTNRLRLTYTSKVYNISIDNTWVCEFENDVCTSSVMTMTYPNANLAQQAYEDAVNGKSADDKTEYSINGKVVTADTTEEYRGKSKQVIKLAMMAIMAQYT